MSDALLSFVFKFARAYQTKFNLPIALVIPCFHDAQSMLDFSVRLPDFTLPLTNFDLVGIDPLLVFSKFRALAEDDGAVVKLYPGSVVLLPRSDGPDLWTSLLALDEFVKRRNSPCDDDPA